MSKEKLVWKDHSGQDYYFDYEVDLNNGTSQENHNGRVNLEEAKERLSKLARKAKLIFTNGHK